MEWRVSDGGDPAALVEGHLAEAGLAVRDLGKFHPPGVGTGVCGAAVLVGAAAGAAMIAAVPASATPAPAVPDLAVVLYDHTSTVPRTARTAHEDGWTLGSWRASWTPEEHAVAVRAVRAAIARGDVYQTNLVGHASAPYTGDPLPALHRVTALPGARYAGLLTGTGWAIACASPETLLDLTAGHAVTRPIKGTAPATPAGAAALRASEKERAEHVMIVDMARNDLGRLARTGSVRVSELFGVRRWVDLWQAESTVEADLRPGVGLAELLRALCPGASVTGAPKLAALAQVAALEPVGRGPSMGALGWIGHAGTGHDGPLTVHLGLTIRTVAADSARLHVWAGGGIVWDSDPDAEVAEAAAKAAPLRRALAG